jgi:hypothetical protein
MMKTSRRLLRLEEFDPRITPAVTRAIGTHQIVDITATPTFEWASGAAVVAGNVIGTDVLMSSLDVTYTLSGEDLRFNKNFDYQSKREEVQWLNEKKGTTISRQQY